MADISKIRTGGADYSLKDAEARRALQEAAARMDAIEARAESNTAADRCLIHDRTVGGAAAIEDGGATAQRLLGNTVRWRQSVIYPFFMQPSNTTDGTWRDGGAETNAEGYELSFDAYETGGYTYCVPTGIQAQGHAFLIAALVKCSGAARSVRVSSCGASVMAWSVSMYNKWQTVATVGVNTSATNAYPFIVRDMRSSGRDTVRLRYAILVDLTEAGMGDCQTPDDVAARLGYHSWEALAASDDFTLWAQHTTKPRLVSVTATGMETHGRNILPAEWEPGSIAAGGEDVEYPTECRTKGYARVEPNTGYILNTDGFGCVVFWYDRDGNFLSSEGHSSADASSIKRSPERAALMRVRTTGGYGTTYRGDICVCLAEHGSDKCPQPWSSTLSWSRALSSCFQGAMRSAGNVRDELTPDRATRRVGSADLSTLTWERVAPQDGTQDVTILRARVTGMAAATQPSTDALCDTYRTLQDAAFDYPGAPDNTLYTHQGYVYIKDTATAADTTKTPSGTLLYPLAGPVAYGQKLAMEYRVESGGHERLVQATGTLSAPVLADIVYGIDCYRSITALRAAQGNLASMRTTAKDSLVAAINELAQGKAAAESNAELLKKVTDELQRLVYRVRLAESMIPAQQNYVMVNFNAGDTPFRLTYTGRRDVGSDGETCYCFGTPAEMDPLGLRGSDGTPTADFFALRDLPVGSYYGTEITVGTTLYAARNRIIQGAAAFDENWPEISDVNPGPRGSVTVRAITGTFQ